MNHKIRTAMTYFWAKPKTLPLLLAHNLVGNSSARLSYCIYDSLRASLLPRSALNCESYGVTKGELDA